MTHGLSSNAFIRSLNNVVILDKFYIEYIDPTDGQKKSEELTNLFLNEHVYVAQIDEDHRSVDTNSMYKALDGSIKKHYKLLDGVQA